MSYSAEIVRRARQRLANQKTDRESIYAEHLQTAYQEAPRLREIDILLRRSMALAAQTVFTQGGDAQKAMEEVKKANLALQEERKQLIAEKFPAGYLDDTPLCVDCGGTGYVGSAMCHCLGRLCQQEQKAAIAALTTGQERFSAFRLDYYPEKTDPKLGAGPRTIMELVLKSCERYVQSFGTGENLLFVGNTGLGKTFLSACIAREVAAQAGASSV